MDITYTSCRGNVIYIQREREREKIRSHLIKEVITEQKQKVLLLLLFIQ